jgi:hypothetical protein
MAVKWGLSGVVENRGDAENEGNVENLGNVENAALAR